MLEDRRLIRKAKLGDQQAFDRIYTQYLDTLLTVAFSLLGSRQEAEDVVQDVFAKLIESLDRFQLRGSLKGFLAVCVANKARDQLRRRGRQEAQKRGNGQNVEPQTFEASWDRAIRSEQIQRVQRALQELPIEQHEIVVLKIHSGLSFRALSRQLNMPLGTVQGRYRYGLDRLRSLLNEEIKQ